MEIIKTIPRKKYATLEPEKLVSKEEELQIAMEKERIRKEKEYPRRFMPK